MKIILGIDPGSRITGFGVIRIIGNHLEYVDSGCIRVEGETLADKLYCISHELESIIDQYQPDESAIEQIFMFHSADSALKLGQARGAAIVALASKALKVSEYSARQVKKAVVGTGAGTKEQVQHMVKVLLNIQHKLQSDAADALAVAICHYHTHQSLACFTGASKIARGRLQ